uniref:Uncharacterized protein n=1 Tax=Romanomermis culicivorax TaxID=13658 RepID=A0A915L4E6_ROMCU
MPDVLSIDASKNSTGRLFWLTLYIIEYTKGSWSQSTADPCPALSGRVSWTIGRKTYLLEIFVQRPGFC